MIQHVPRILLAVLMVLAAMLIESTTGDLPETVATHFAGSGRPNDFMSNDGYRLFMLFFAIGFPLFVTLMVTYLPRRFPGQTNIPHRNYWLAPERREASLEYLGRHGLYLGCLLVLFSSGIHLLILDAHQQTPPQLDEQRFLLFMAVFIAGVGVWIALLFRRFKKPRTP